jgi:hypothetical protein
MKQPISMGLFFIRDHHFNLETLNLKLYSPSAALH